MIGIISKLLHQDCISTEGEEEGLLLCRVLLHGPLTQFVLYPRPMQSFSQGTIFVRNPAYITIYGLLDS